jgi:serine/threonine protein kinase/tetratricopeptide (TPR) repeat protein
MEHQRWAVIESLYERALELDPAERMAWLQKACGGDADLFSEVTSLLACADAHLSNPAARPKMAKLWHQLAGDPDIDSRALEDAEPANSNFAGDSEVTTFPSTIGSYRIVRIVGEGGMGVVYEAEQDHPRRTVAVKVIKSGRSDPRLVRRFELELLALGRLQHPGIAQIYEAGTAESGFGPQPYFAMEFVRGEPLLEYAEAHHLSTRQRLEIMARICDAIHHAHQRGIIHRDLKPGNILVDETGQPKILDFGVARATDSDVWATQQTDLGQLVGTLAYMSPEQVLVDSQALDTRSDVYALGVVLYQLLAGRLPYKVSARLPEAVRTIQEDEPRLLSTVSSEYRGDIETIVAKALEKDKTRRYSSAAELAADIRHHLHDEPITARPASTIYQLQKFARRHKGLVLGIAAVFLVLIAGIIASTREAARANREAATSRAISDFLQNDLLAQASAANQAGPNTKPDPDLKVRTAVDRAAARISGRFDKQPEIEAAIRDTIGQVYLDLGLYPEARTQFDRALDLQRRVLGAKNPETLKTLNRIGYSAFLQGKYPEAEALLRQTLEMQRRVLGTEHRDTLSSIGALADVYWRQSKYPEAEALYSKAFSIQRRLLGPEHPDTLESMHDMAIVYFERGKYAQAEGLENQTLEIRRRVLGSEHPQTLASMDNLASVYYAQGKYAQAEALEGQTLEIRRRVLGPEHPQTLMSMDNLANVYDSEGKYAAAESLHSASLEITRRIFGSENSDTLMSMNNLANVYFAEGKYQQAEALYTETIQIQRRVLGPEHPDTLASTSDLAGAYAAQRKYKEAVALYSQDLEMERRVLGPEHPDFLGTISAAGSMYQREGKYPQAETFAGQALAGRRHALGSEDTDTMSSAADLALAYESQGQFAKAEPLARESVEFYQKQQPDDWQRFRAESLLGVSLAGQKKYAEAERLLLEGYEGMVARKERIAVPDLYQIDLARARLTELYLAWGKPAKAADWKKNPQARGVASNKK